MTQKDPEFVKTLLHFCKYANAAYGWKLVYAYQRKDDAYVANLLKGFTANDSTSTRVSFK